MLSGLLFLTCFEIGLEAIRRVFRPHGEASQATLAAFAVVGVTLVVNILVDLIVGKLDPRIGLRSARSD